MDAVAFALTDFLPSCSGVVGPISFSWARVSAVPVSALASAERDYLRVLAFACSRVRLSGFASQVSLPWYPVYGVKMEKTDLDSLNQLDDEVLREVVREAERTLDAQLTTATAADQRAMAWAAMLVTGAVALTGASAALLVSGKNLLLAGIGVFISFLLGIALLKAIDTFRPKEWHYPGNRPANWLPANWQCDGSGTPCNIRQARLEQAVSLDEQIVENANAADAAGRELKLSMDLAVYTIVVGIVLVGILIIAKAVSGAA